MTATMNTTVCVHCDAPLIETDRRAGWCGACGKRLLTSQMSGSAQTAKAKKAPQPAPENKKAATAATDGDEIGMAVLGWTLMMVVLVPLLSLLFVPPTLNLILTTVIVTLFVTIPVSWLLSTYSPIIRLVGVGISCVIQFVLCLLDLIGSVLSCLG